MPIFKADLHIHSCLSPCADLLMSPRAIVKAAKERGIGILSLTDHNCCGNSAVMATLCKEAGIGFIYGIEATTCEEVHLLCYFGNQRDCDALGSSITATLPSLPSVPLKDKCQILVNRNDEVLGFMERNLMGAATMSMDEIEDFVTHRGGVVIPAHIDRPSFSIISQLGFLPDGKSYPAVEMIKRPKPISFQGYEVIANSDAHSPERVGTSFTELLVDSLSPASIISALKNFSFQRIRNNDASRSEKAHGQDSLPLSAMAQPLYPAPQKEVGSKHMITNKNCILRLSRYKNALHRFKMLGFIKVFSDYLADACGVTSVQVRKDFSIFGIMGNKRGGYQIDALIEQLNNILGKNELQKVILVGAGNLGFALMKYRNFEMDGIKIVAAFDIDPSKLNPKDTVPVLPLDSLIDFVKNNGVKIGILCVPIVAAQATLDLMMTAGLKGVLNFAPIQLKAADDRVINNVTFEVELENLIYFVNALEKAPNRRIEKFEPQLD